MKLFKTILVFLIIFIVLLLNNNSSMGLFIVNNLARLGDYTIFQNIQYADNQDQILDIYIPDGIDDLDKSNIPTVVFLYGGCWGACSDLAKEDYRFVAQSFTTNNIISVIVDYRKFPTVLFPDIMADVTQAVEWVNENIDSYGGNAENLFLMGHSSGAHLASMLSFNEQYLKANTYQNIRGFIGLAGPYDFLPFTEYYQPSLFAPVETYAESQTINFVEGTEPPSLLMYGNSDKRVQRRNIISLTKMIKHKKGYVKTYFYDDIDHVGIISAMSMPLRSLKPILRDILVFISQMNKNVTN